MRFRSLQYLIIWIMIFVAVILAANALYQGIAEEEILRSGEEQHILRLIEEEGYACYVDGVELESIEIDKISEILYNYSYLIDHDGRKLVFSLRDGSSRTIMMPFHIMH